MDDLPEIVCPECDLHFTVIWSNDGLGPAAEYCPRCGAPMPETEEPTDDT